MAVKVSIVIPSLNVSDYIVECIESVINQSLKEIEIICVDAGSTDGTLEILKRYERIDDRIKVVVSEKKSYGYQVNLGMDIAKGKYFAIVESDDIIALDMYEKLYQIAEEKQLDVIKADFYRFVMDNDTMVKTYNKLAYPGMYGRVLTDENRAEIIMKASLFTWSGIYRKDFLYENSIRHNETPGASYQDNGFWFQTMSTASRVYFLEQPFYMLRRDNPNSSVLSKGKVYCVRDEYEFILQYLEQREDLYNKMISYYWWARFGAYHYSYHRIGPEYKREFIIHFHETFMLAQQKNELNKELFSKKQRAELEQILQEPLAYNAFYQKKAERESQKRTMLNRFLWCYQDNGLRYTLKHLLNRVKQKLSR